MLRPLPILAAVCLSLVATSCKDAAPEVETPVVQQPAEPVAQPEPAPPREEPGVVRTGLASLRETAGPKGKWQATLLRGEKVDVLEKSGENFYQVRLSDGSTGFIEAKHLLLGEIEELLVVDDKPLYQRPDRAALREGTVKLGTLLFVLKEKGDWFEVQLPKGRTGWMQGADVSRDERELIVARNLYRHELLKDAKQKARQQQAVQILAETIAQYPDSKVLAASGLAPGASADTPVEGEGEKPTAEEPAAPVAGEAAAPEPAAKPEAAATPAPAPGLAPAPAPAPAAAPAPAKPAAETP